MISEYGFICKGNNERGENVYNKSILFRENVKDYQKDFFEINKKFYPSFYDGEKVNKFMVPILPKYHNILFPDYKNNFLLQKELNFYDIKACGYAIKKVYLSKSFSKEMKIGDILLFYRSHDLKSITTLGIVEKVHNKIKDFKEVIKLIKSRSVYEEEDIKKLCEGKGISIIFFKCLFHFNNDEKFSYIKLNEEGIVKGPVQRLQKVKDNNYKKIVNGVIDGLFTIH